MAKVPQGNEIDGTNVFTASDLGRHWAKLALTPACFTNALII